METRHIVFGNLLALLPILVHRDNHDDFATIKKL